MTTIAVVAMGAMGAGVAGRLRSRGARVVTMLEGRSAGSRERAASAGVEDVGLAGVAAAEVILSVVPPDQAVGLARRIGAVAAGTPLFVDCNAVNPATAEAVGAALGSGAQYVDGSIIGGPPAGDGAGPTFYLAGAEADRAASVLGAFGVATRVLPGGIGAASALKMSYAGITKGLTGLAAAMILAAERAGAGEALAAELAASQPALLARFRKGVPDMLPKAYRWVPEMREIAGFVGEGPGAAIYEGVAAVFAAVAEDEAVRRALLGFVEG